MWGPKTRTLLLFLVTLRRIKLNRIKGNFHFKIAPPKNAKSTPLPFHDEKLYLKIVVSMSDIYILGVDFANFLVLATFIIIL